MKNKKRLIGILIFLLLISIFFITGYAFARYYKTVDVGRTKANVARWSLASSNTNTNINLSNEKIAPGSRGQFEIEVDATDSEVGVDYEIKVDNEKNIPRNMRFYAETKDEVGNVAKTEEKNSFSEIATESLKGTIPVELNNQKRIVVVHWNWPFNENDETLIDSEDATLKENEDALSLECGFDIQIIGKQAIMN